MPEETIYSDTSMAKRSRYLCQVCSFEFELETREAVCPRCGNSSSERLTVIDQVNSKEMERLLTDDDFHGG